MICFTSIESVPHNLSGEEIDDCRTILMALQSPARSSNGDLIMDLRKAESDANHNLSLWFEPTAGHTVKGLLNILGNIQYIGRGNGNSSGFAISEVDGCIRLAFPHD